MSDFQTEREPILVVACTMSYFILMEYLNIPAYTQVRLRSSSLDSIIGILRYIKYFIGVSPQYILKSIQLVTKGAYLSKLK